MLLRIFIRSPFFLSFVLFLPKSFASYFHNIILDNNLCVINVRGGEYKNHPELILQPSYYYNAMRNIKNDNPNIQFIVVSDDVPYAQSLFPNIRCVHFDIGLDYYIINKAKWLIISNSSFAWVPSYLNDECNKVIAPKYWARYNVSNGYWSSGSIFTSTFYYMNRDGILQTYNECVDELFNSEYKEYYV